MGACILMAWLCACGSEDSASRSALAADIFAPLGEPLPFLSNAERETTTRGREVALQRFSPESGLGPQFNVSFCAACHEKPTLGGVAGRYRQFHLVGYRAEVGAFNLRGKSGVIPHYSLPETVRSRTPSDGNVMATRKAIPFYGSGLLSEIPDNEILSRSDEYDRDGDGISGRVNYDGRRVGRFGRKAQNASIESFVRGPMFNHAGVTSNPLSPERRRALALQSPDFFPGPDLRLGGGAALLQGGAPDAPLLDDDAVADPELGEEDLFALVSFTISLAAPEPDPLNETSYRGQQTFREIGCDACHTPVLTSRRGGLPLYSDLLLHDLGDELADGIEMGRASGREFRTQPLWGISATGPYLHDGRADDLDEAIRLHAGEGLVSRDRYLALTTEGRDELLAFLSSLGGNAQATSGMLPPGFALSDDDFQPPQPRRALNENEKQAFMRGLALFDRDVGLHQGLGPEFNGDSCRACHFDPAIGGAGPGDLDVIRIDPSELGDAASTGDGALLARHRIPPGRRPEPPSGIRGFARRQTPSLFGLGLVDEIRDEDILAHADPEDRDGDGISGRARILAGGRLGRLGWRANVPDLEAFARDAMSNELGLTVPTRADSPFGLEVDSDSAADPEVSTDELDDLVFFMTMLAPLHSLADPEGEALFEELGCGACHIPTLQARGGEELLLYSDLLLHDVGTATSAERDGTEVAAGEFRTPPLWGLRFTAPYMHDGRASTVAAAIMAHAGEALTSAQRWQSQPLARRERLLKFLETR